VSSLLQAIGKTPLVRITSWHTRAPIFGKCEHLNPAGSVKDRLALALVEDGERSGRLKPGGTIVEATAGNTGMGLALVAAARKYKLVCVLPEKMSVDKRKALKAVGAEVIVTANAPLDSPENFRNVAQRLSRENDWFLADQFRNQANVEAHFRHTGPEIFQELGQVGAFVAGVGTGGTITGVGRFLKSKNPKTVIVLADPKGSSLADWINCGQYGPDEKYLVEGIGSSRTTEIMDKSVVDLAITVTDEESFQTALKLQREEGLLVGGSSGTALAAALRLDQTRDIDGPIVCLLADSWDRYFSQPWMS
jgi:cysteine synthase